MNKNEYLREVKSFLQARSIVMYQIIEAQKNALETGSDETLLIREQEYKTKLQMIYSKFNRINPPSGFETAHKLYLESLNYSIKGEEIKATEISDRAANEIRKAAGLR